MESLPDLLDNQIATALKGFTSKRPDAQALAQGIYSSLRLFFQNLKVLVDKTPIELPSMF